MDKLAMWIGYAVIGLGALAAVAAIAGSACTYAWRKMLHDVPSWLYVQNAVAFYREKYPPGRWAREQMGHEWPKPKA